jgi:magnesium transporter
MQQIVYRSEHPPFTWLDVTAPSEEELQELAAKYHLHAAAVQDCLDPEHLPKYERFADTSFLILRVYDPAAADSADTVQQLTRKIAIFSRQDLTLTIHRVDLAVVADVRTRLGGPHPESECTPLTLLAALVNGSLDSYDRPLQRAEEQIDAFEEALFRRDIDDPSLELIHVLKRRVGLIKRMLWQTQNVIARLTPAGERPLPLHQDLKENAESYYFWADELHEDLNNLLSMHVTMASQRTNEVMRVLTVFSAFFLPLTFVVGVYGMNFRFMPELEQRWGYPMVLGLMAVISLVIFIWFRRRGWLGRRRP